MSKSTSADLPHEEVAAAAPFLLRRHPGVPGAGVFLIGLIVTAAALSKSLLIGRLEFPITHNDVGYLIDGIHRLAYFDLNGFWAELVHLYWVPLHAPFSAYLAALGFGLFGFHDWAPYLSDIILVWVLLAASAWLLRGYPDVVVIAGLLAVAGIPLTTATITEFAPEVPLGLFTALGVLFTLPIPMLEPALPARVKAGLVFGLAFLAKPSSLAFIPLVVCATLGVMYIRDIVIARRFRQWHIGIFCGFLQLALSLWFAALYIVPNIQNFASYFYTALFDKANVIAFGYFPDLKENILYCLTGDGGEYTFGNFLWAYLIVIGAGIVAAIWRRDRQFVSEQVQFLILAFFMYLLPTLSAAKNFLFGTPFAFLLIFMIVLALRSIFDTIRGPLGAGTVLLLGGFLLLTGTSRENLPNMPFDRWTDTGPKPEAHVLQEMWPAAQNRFYDDLLGNSPEYHGGSVYLPEGAGFYHAGTLMYWFLKKDFTLDWTWYANWAEPNPDVHMKSIHDLKPEFVIVGERGNGLTFDLSLIPGTAAAENGVLAALWKDPDYMPLDQFYGPAGPTITVFQRSTNFAGWRALAGIKRYGSIDHPEWMNLFPVFHIGAYAPDAVASTLTMDATGLPGETIRVSANGETIGTLTIDSNGNGSLVQALNLRQGQNDIVFRETGYEPFYFKRLVISRKIHRDE